ncbi:hypothetical protein [Streptomyces hiroshimensis]|uniref:Uncharacterized protein n=1 Tax=Streptomyces hiroshimensis TaxID=66424 RepID=A0ABQ2Z2Y8_9ACTN|nr:hypothetical protein [Streptomyces hiroshimensis]GGY01591.1 hypothetical protein GCM10010324_55690 [Streptomyces hiroshimensis]
MTTTPHLAFPPAPPAPSPAGRPGNRRMLVAGAVAALVLLLAAAAAGGWWLTRDEDSSPFAGRPRVTDGAAGLSYAIPEGWKHEEQQKLIGAFTSSVTKTDTGGEGGSTVLSGRAGAVPQPALQRQAERAARSNAEFFYPDGSSEIEESRPTTVDGRPAHTVALRVSDGKHGTGSPEGSGGAGHLRLTLVAVDDSRSAFLLGIAQPGGPVEAGEVDKVMESASLN